MMNSWILAGEASWYKAEELKSYTNPLNSVAYFWDESYDRAGDMIENAAYNACYDRITKFNVVVDGIARPRERKRTNGWEKLRHEC